MKKFTCKYTQFLSMTYNYIKKNISYNEAFNCLYFKVGRQLLKFSISKQQKRPIIIT